MDNRILLDEFFDDIYAVKTFLKEGIKLDLSKSGMGSYARLDDVLVWIIGDEASHYLDYWETPIGKFFQSSDIFKKKVEELKWEDIRRYGEELGKYEMRAKFKLNSSFKEVIRSYLYNNFIGI